MRGLVIATATAAVLASGCSKPNPTGPIGNEAAAAVGTVDACSILTKADAEQALGRPVQKLAATGGAAALEICQYGYQGEKLADMGQVSVTYHPNSLSQMREGVIAAKAAVEDIPGVGQGAFYSRDYGLYVGRGGRSAVYMLGAGGMDEAEAKRRLIALAKATVGRL